MYQNLYDVTLVRVSVIGNLIANENQSAKCSQEGYSDSECENTPHCTNEGNHCAYSKECVEWIKQKITRVKYEQNTSFNNTTNRTVSSTNCAGLS